MRYLFLFVVCSLVLSPGLAHAQALTDVYGDSVYAYSQANLWNPENAALAPDGLYADFRDSQAYVTIDMGEGEEGYGPLILTTRILEYGAAVRVTYYDADFTVLGQQGVIFERNAETTAVPYYGDAFYRYVKIETTENEQWGLDAIQATQVKTPVEDVEEEQPCGCSEPDVPYDRGTGVLEAGSLVRSAENSAVYFIGQDSKRHAFPNERVFGSWGYSFDDVQIVSAADLASYMLGANVTIRPGTWLVKVPFNPKTYAVEPGGVLRWVKTEAVAQEIYGDYWNMGVTDVDESLWKNYHLGADIASSDDFPLGAFVVDHSNLYLHEAEGLRALNQSEWVNLRADRAFALDRAVTASDALSGGVNNEDLTDFLHPY